MHFLDKLLKLCAITILFLFRGLAGLGVDMMAVVVRYVLLSVLILGTNIST